MPLTGIDELAAVLDIQPDGSDTWVGCTPAGSGRATLYGGIVAAQALRAGHQSVGDGRRPSSLHAYFLRSGRHGEPVQFRVEALRQGRAFANRRIDASQSDGTIMTMMASFQTPEAGHAYHVDSDTGPPPASGTTTAGTGGETGMAGDGAFDIVDLQPGPRVPGSLDWTLCRYWARVRDRLPHDDGIHACALVAMADLRTSNPPRLARDSEVPVQMTSLDFAVWFHRPVRADDWLHFDLRPGGNGGARGLTVGVVSDEVGDHVATFTMDLLLRDRPDQQLSGDAE